MTDIRNIVQLKSASQVVGDGATISPETALRRALFRAAHMGLGLQLEIGETKTRLCDRDDVIEGVQATDLIVKLEQDSEAPGVMALDLDLVSSLVEVQTLGKVLKDPAKTRVLTSTDAAVAMPLIDGTLSSFERLTTRPEKMPAPGFHFGAWLPDLGLLAAQLPDGPYFSYDLSVSIGTGNRVGRLFLALPVPPKPIEETVETQSGDQAVLAHEIMDAPARLDAVLYRLELPLGEIGDFKVGDALTLPLQALSEVALHAGDRKAIAVGVLGQLSGQRAICLKDVGEARATQRETPADQAKALASVDLADPALLKTIPEKVALPSVVPTAEPKNIEGIPSDTEVGDDLHIAEGS